MGLETTVIPQKRQVIYDTYANFPTSGLEKGDLAWATDRKCLYRWNGSAWEAIGISSRHGDYADIGNPANYPESSLYQADDQGLLYMVVTGAWEQITTLPGMPLWVAGDVIAVASETEATTQEETLTKVKEIQIATGGTIRTYFEIKSSPSYDVYGQIYKNGSPHGTLRLQGTAEEWLGFSEDLAFSALDLVQLYIRITNDSSTAYCRYFRLKADKGHGHIKLLE